MDEKALGKRLQLARKRAGLTQQELCQKAGLSYSTLAKIERGAIRSPSVFTVAHIASATGMNMEDLLEVRSGPNSPAPSGKKRSKSGLTFAFFDVNGTLARYYERAFTRIAEESHVSAEIVETLFLHYDGAACRGAMANQEVEKIFAGELGLPDFSWEKYYMESIEPTPGSADLLRWAADNYHIGLLTNNWLGYTDELIRRQVVPDASYTAIVESAKAGCAKPEAKIYEIAQQLAGVEASEILLVDDAQAYLAGAQKAGWQTVWFDETQPEASIERVKQVLAF
ncbi:MAG TPA: HAD-IA family hydrolase [Candidatus Saccharimonadales bacterium]|nr:HAD-IA family hydrolase [Candidatus Saccharimonadales bacterium]